MSALAIGESSLPNDEYGDNPSGSDPLEQVVKDLKSAGSEALDENRYWDAIDNFSLALFYREDASVLANRAMAYLELEKQVFLGIEIESRFSYYVAYIDANEALKLKEDFAAAWCIKALALSGLGYYTEARECLDTCLELDPTNMDAKLAKFSIASSVSFRHDHPSLQEDNYLVEPDKLIDYDPHKGDSPRLIDLITGAVLDMNINDAERTITNEEAELGEQRDNETYVVSEEDYTQSDLDFDPDGSSSVGDMHEVS